MACGASSGSAPGQGFNKRVLYGSEGCLDWDSGLWLRDGSHIERDALVQEFTDGLGDEERERLFPGGTTNPIAIEFGIAGMSVVAAGMNDAHSGHHHLLIDTDPPDMGLPIPADAHHVHFGDASTSTELTLAPGTHTLRLLLGDHLHIPHNPPIMSEPISITVE